MVADAHFRRGRDGSREPIPPAGECVHLPPIPKHQHWGVVTSRPRKRWTREELESIAFRLKITVAAAKRAADLGMFDG